MTPQAPKPPRPDPIHRPINLRWNGWHPPFPVTPRLWLVTKQGAIGDFVNVIDNDGLGRFGRIVGVEVRQRKAPRRWWQLRHRTYMQRRIKIVWGFNRADVDTHPVFAAEGSLLR